MGKKKNRLTATKQRNRFCIIFATGAQNDRLSALVTVVPSVLPQDGCGGRYPRKRAGAAG
jgi:hypothetical protein